MVNIDDELLLMEDENVFSEADDDETNYIDLDISDMKVGLTFDNEDIALNSIQKWTRKALCPLSKVRNQKSKVGQDGERTKGRRCFKCCHGLNRNSRSKVVRPHQRIKNTRCQVKLNINEQEDGTWMVTTCMLEHSGHPVTEMDFLSHQAARKLKEEDKAFVKGLVKARANCRNIADVLTERTGVNYNAQDIRNLITKIDKDEKTAASVEEILGDIKDNGGDVRYRKEENTNNVEVLWVQTKEMRSQLAQSKPLVFECDTTFGTQVEGYKFYIPVFYSNFTAKWEVSGLLFFTTETKEKVEIGLNFFKSSLPYNFVDGVTKFIFFSDKDFDYIDVSYNYFSQQLFTIS